MENQFITGLYFKRPHENAPDFVKLKGSIKREDMIKYLQALDGDFVNFDLCESKPKPDGSKSFYARKDDWKPQTAGQEQQAKEAKELEQVKEDFNVNDIPFD